MFGSMEIDPGTSRFRTKSFMKGFCQGVLLPWEKVIWAILKAKITNVQGRARAYEIGKRHYDIGNNLFSIMLDKMMNYSCGFWNKARSLDNAQEEKIYLNRAHLSSRKRFFVISCAHTVEIEDRK